MCPVLLRHRRICLKLCTAHCQCRLILAVCRTILGWRCFLLSELGQGSCKQKIDYYRMLENRVIGDLDGSVIEAPNKHMEKLVDYHNLLHRRYRSLFLVPSLLLNMDRVKKGVYQLYVQI